MGREAASSSSLGDVKIQVLDRQRFFFSGEATCNMNHHIIDDQYDAALAGARFLFGSDSAWEKTG
jgi:hypothetical protein